MCQLYNKVFVLWYSGFCGQLVDSYWYQALLSVFKGRVVDAREKGTSIEKCEVNIQDQPDKTECRLIIKMICRHGLQEC